MLDLPPPLPEIQRFVELLMLTLHTCNPAMDPDDGTVQIVRFYDARRFEFPNIARQIDRLVDNLDPLAHHEYTPQALRTAFIVFCRDLCLISNEFVAKFLTGYASIITIEAFASASDSGSDSGSAHPDGMRLTTVPIDPSSSSSHAPAAIPRAALINLGSVPLALPLEDGQEALSPAHI